MNPILRFFLGAYLRHISTIIITLLVTRHYIGQDIADKLNRGDTVTLWDGYTFSINTIVDYVLLTLIPVTLVPILASVWSRIKSRFKTLIALKSSTAHQVESAVNTTPSTEMIRAVAKSSKTLGAVVIAFLMLGPTGCATLEPGADPLVVNAERTLNTATDVFDTFVRIEFDNREYIKTHAPEVHAYAEKIRRDALTKWIPTARAMKTAYLSNRSPQNKANLESWINVLTTAITQSQQYLNKINQP